MDLIEEISFLRHGRLSTSARTKRLLTCGCFDENLSDDGNLQAVIITYTQFYNKGKLAILIGCGGSTHVQGRETSNVDVFKNEGPHSSRSEIESDKKR